MLLHRDSITGLARRRFALAAGTIAALVALDLLLALACVLAVGRNLSLRRLLSVDTSLLTPEIGSGAPPIAGRNWAGSLQTVTYQQDSRPTAVYTFTKDCPHCEHNWKAMRELQALSPQRLRMVYVDTAEALPPGYLAASGIGNALVFARLSPTSALAYEARAVPQLELLDRNGRVQWAHLGELNATDISDALATIENDQKH